MKTVIISIVLCCALGANAQETAAAFDGHKWEAPYVLPIPKDWTIERFLLPPFFAPSIRYKGIEDIRFMPGWNNSASEEYWTYAFLWFLEEKPSLVKDQIEKDLAAYYTGLYKINYDSIKHKNESPIPVIVELNSADTLPGELTAYTGTVQMADYMTRKPITLHCKVHARFCTATNKNFLFFELSPKAFDNKVWMFLDQLWTDFKCDKNR